MSKPKFASKQAEKLATENEVTFSDNFSGSGKKGTITVSDVRGLFVSLNPNLTDGAAVDSEQPTAADLRASAAPKSKKQPRYVVEKNPNGHVDLYNVVDTSKPEGHQNRVVKDYGSEVEAIERAKQLNG